MQIKMNKTIKNAPYLNTYTYMYISFYDQSPDEAKGLMWVNEIIVRHVYVQKGLAR